MESQSQTLNIDIFQQALASEEIILFAYLFGSYATGDTTPLSDIDLAVYPSHKLNLDERLGIIQRLQKKTKLENLDIAFLDRLSNFYLLEDIFDHGIILKDKDQDIRDYFEVMTHHKFIDFQYQRKLFMGA